MSTYHNPLCEAWDVADSCRDCKYHAILVVQPHEESLVFCPDHLPSGSPQTYHVYAEADSLHQLAARYPSASISDVLGNGDRCWEHPDRESIAIGCGVSGPGFVTFCEECAHPNRKELGFSLWWPLEVSIDDAIKIGDVDGYYLTPGGWNPLLGRWGGWDEPGEVTIP
jgi:hypothetical protein